MPIKFINLEKDFFNQGYKTIAGIDEAGRGPLAGPVVAAAVILNPKSKIKDLNDSKLLKEDARKKAYDEIMRKAKAVSFYITSEKVIDRINILQATFVAMRGAIDNIKQQVDFVLVDGSKTIPQVTIPQKAIISGDRLCSSIAAASIIAKVERDKIMEDLDKKYPQYGFIRNKGYGTEEHLKALYKHGPTQCHRRSFNLNKQLKLF